MAQHDNKAAMRPFAGLEIEVYTASFVKYAICPGRPVSTVFCGP